MDRYCHEAIRENIPSAEFYFAHVDVEGVHALRVQRSFGFRRVTGPGHFCFWQCTSIAAGLK